MNCKCEEINNNIENLVALSEKNWDDDGQINDSLHGWSNEKWELTLNTPQNLTIIIEDVGSPGDYFEVYINNKLIGTTFKPNCWGYSQVGALSFGKFTVSLSPGTYIISIRDAGLDGHTQEEIKNEKMCPAGFKIKGRLSPVIKSVK